LEEEIMNDTLIVTVFVVLDEVMQAAGHRDHVLAQVPDAEVLTVAVVAAAAFQNHHERALQMLLRLGYLSGHLSVSRFNRRLHALGSWLVQLLELIGELFTQQTVLFGIDSLPIPACHRARAHRCRTVQGRAYLGYVAAKRQWFFGWRLHLVVTPLGIPVNVVLLPASQPDLAPVHELLYGLPAGACVDGDKAYNSKKDEASIHAETGVRLVPLRKKKMEPNPWIDREHLFVLRTRIETVGSQLAAMGIERIHARTTTGVEIKVVASLVAMAWINIIANAIPLALELLSSN
jgi:hypothetical protein